MKGEGVGLCWLGFSGSGTTRRAQKSPFCDIFDMRSNEAEGATKQVLCLPFLATFKLTVGK